VLAPSLESGKTRLEMSDYARVHGIAVPETASQALNIDGNLWGRSIEWRLLEDPWTEPPEEIYALTRPAPESPDEAAYVELTFEAGVPTGINGVAMPILDLIGSLGTIAGAHGVGRIDMVENRVAGAKSREVYEAPAALVLHTAHKELQKLVVSRDLERFARSVSLQYADVIYNGLWFTPLREALNAFVDTVQARVTGAVRLKLFKGDCRVAGRRSPYALNDPAAEAPGAGAAARLELAAVKG
jgi:argininosuccinate synthase